MANPVTIDKGHDEPLYGPDAPYRRRLLLSDYLRLLDGLDVFVDGRQVTWDDGPFDIEVDGWREMR